MKNLFFLTVIFISCKAINNDTYIKDQYEQFLKTKATTTVNDTIIAKDTGVITKTLFTSSSVDNSLKSIKCWLQNNPNQYGHYFKFDKANLIGYYFLCGDDNCNSYEITKAELGYKYLEKGSSFVDFFSPAEISDSLNDYTLLFSSFPRKVVSSFVLKNNTLTPINLKESKLFPFLLEGTLICTRKELENGIAIKTKVSELVFPISGLESSREYTDTLKTTALIHQN